VREIACWPRCRHMKNCKSELVRVLVSWALPWPARSSFSRRRPFIPPIRVPTRSNRRPQDPQRNEVADVLDIEYSVDMSNAPRMRPLLSLATRRLRTRSRVGVPPDSRKRSAQLHHYDESGSIAPVIFAWVGADQLFGQKNVNALTVPIVDALALTTPAASFSSTMT